MAPQVSTFPQQQWEGLADRGPYLLTPDRLGERAFWPLLFITRHVAISALAIMAAALPEFGDDRWIIAVILGGGVLPFDVGVHLYARRHGRIPALVPFAYAPVPGAFVAVFPELWIPGLIAALGNVVLFAIVVDVRGSMATAVITGVALGVGAAISGPDMARVGTVTFAIVTPAVVLGVAALFEALGLSQMRYRNYVENAQDMIYVHDLDGVFRAANETALALTGYTREEFGRVAAADIVAPGYVDEAYERIQRAVSTGESDPVPWELEIITRSGQRIPVEVNTRVIYDRGRPVGIHGIARDIRERKTVEAERASLDHARSEFITNAAHELRTPLTTLAGLASVMASNRERMTDEELDEAIEALARQGRRARTLADKLLDLSTLESGHLEVVLERVSVEAAVHQALEEVPAPPETRVAVSVEPDLQVLADPVRLQEILHNLLGNAYRHGGTRVEVAATARNGVVHLDVRDNGPGVPAELRAQLFEPFARGDSSPGTGLGLAICARLAEALGGAISYQEAEPNGACFRLDLPARR